MSYLRDLAARVRQVEKLTGRCAGITLIMENMCPKGQNSTDACVTCSTGHLSLCHHPQTCAEARCPHQRSTSKEVTSP